MTAEEFIKVLENEDMLSGCELNKTLLIELLNNFASQPKWIPVSERLPEFHPFNNFKPYLVTEDDESFISHYDQDSKKFCYMNNGGTKIFINVSAWMEIPKPYTEK